MGREPLGPPPGGGPPPPGEPGAPGAPDEPGGPAWPERVEDQIRNLKQLAAALGVLALLALGVALWALLADDDEETTRGGVGRERVARLDDRVDRLERATDDASDSGDIERAVEDKADQEAVDSLREDVEELRSQLEDAGSGDDAAQAVDQLSQRVDELEQDVEELQNQQQP